MTGHVYQTTRGAAMDAHSSAMKHKLMGSVALGTGYMFALDRLLDKKVPWWIKAPAAAYAGAKTYDAGFNMARPWRNPEYITDQGIVVPGNTEFAKVGALTPSTYFDKVIYDVVERTGDTNAPLHRLNTKIAAHDPYSVIARFLNAPSTYAEKAAALCDGLEYYSEPVGIPEIDFESLSARIGDLLLS
jgi:hypothetical protein